MSVRNSLGRQELIRLANLPGHAVHWRLEVTVMVQGQPIRITNIISETYQHKFYRSYYGTRQLVLRMDAVAYRHLLKFRNELIIELRKAEEDPTGKAPADVKRYAQTFKAYLTEMADPAISAKLGEGEDTNNTNVQLANQLDVTFDLIEPIISDLRMESIGGVFKKKDKKLTIKEFFRITLGYRLGPDESKEALLDEEFTDIRGVDVVDPENEREYEHIVVKEGTPLYKLPRLIQEQYGVYASGIGFSIYRGWVFIYPALNYTRFEDREQTLTILNIPEREIPSMSKTYIYEGKQLYIFATGQSSHNDEVNRLQLNKGNGIRFSRASDFINKNPDEEDYAEQTTNKAIFDRKKKVVEYIIEEKKDEKMLVRPYDLRFTDNPFQASSELALAMGTTFTVQWDRAAPELLFPGMQVKVLFMDGETLYNLFGVLIGIEYVTKTKTGAITDLHFITSVHLVIHLERRELAEEDA